MSATEYRLGLVLVTASAIAWSTAGFFTRLIPLDSRTLLAWRGIFGAIGIAIVAGGNRTPRLDERNVLLVFTVQAGHSGRQSAL